MKNLKYLLLSMLILLISMIKVNAEVVDASVKIVGRNTFGRELKVEIDCKEAGTSDCYISDTRWYYNSTNSTEGGTEIIDEYGSTGIRNYEISEDLIGKYIYVVVTIASHDSNYEPIILTDITDATTNVTATVDNYIDYIDNNNYSITATATFGTGAGFTMTLNGIEVNDKIKYYVYLSNGEKPNISENSYGCDNFDIDEYDYPKFKEVVDNNEIYTSYDWYLLKGYDKAYILSMTQDDVNGGYYCEVTENPITIEKPSIPPLGKRFQFYLFSNEQDKDLSTYQQFPYFGKFGSHTLITKVGLINDTNLLKKLAKGTDDSLQVLLDYSKNNDGTIFKYNDDQGCDIGNFKVTDGSYYYIYTTYENSDGLYRDFSDVSVAMGVAGNLSNDVNWDNFEEEKIDAVWENFVKSVKENALFKDNKNITIEYDIDSMDITADNIKITFNYSNGIVSYAANNNASYSELSKASSYQAVLLEEFFEIFKYDKEKALKYIEENPTLTITNDGFEYVLKEYEDEKAKNSGKVFTTLKFDLVNGLKNFNKNVDVPIPEDKLPQTGFWFAISSIVILIVFGAIGLYINHKIKKENKIIKL